MTIISLNYFKLQRMEKAQVNVGCHTDKQCYPRQYAKLKCSLSEPNVLSISRGFQNNLEKMEFKGQFCFPRDMNKQPLKIVLFEDWLFHHASSCFSGFRPELASK